MSEDLSGDCYRKAVDLLARRAHLRAGLAAKLAARGFSGEQVAAVCDRLEADGLLDDRDCAMSLADGPFRRKGYGPLRVRAELRRRGVAETLVEEVLAASFARGEGERARAVAARWKRPGREEPAALARHLERKGFTAGAIAGVLSDRD